MSASSCDRTAIETATLAVALAAFAVAAAVAQADEKEDRIAAFRRDAPKAWNEVINWTAHSRASVRDSVAWPDRPQKDSFCFESDYVLDGDRGVKRTVVTAGRERSVLSGKGDVDAWAVGQNADYTFHLLRNQKSQKWLITYIGDGRNNSSIAEDFSDGVLTDLARRCLLVCRCLLPDLLADQGLQVLDVSEPDADGLVRVDCQYVPAEEPWYKFRAGSLWLNPTRSWVMVRYSASVLEYGETLPCSYEATFEYDDRAAHPMLKRFAEVGKSPHGNQRHLQIEFSNQQYFKSAPDDEFRLTAFGLPEVGIPTKGNGYTWWIGLLLGVLCLAAGAWFARRARLLGG